MARQTDGPFTQASRNRHGGPARDEDVGTDGNATRRGSTTSPWNTHPTNKGSSFHGSGESNNGDGGASALRFKHTCDRDNDKAEQLTTPGRRIIPRPWAQRGRALTPETQLVGVTCPALEQTRPGAKEEGRRGGHGFPLATGKGAHRAACMSLGCLWTVLPGSRAANLCQPAV